MGSQESTAQVLSHREVAKYYEELKAALSKQPELPKTSTTAAEVRQRLQAHDTKKHACLRPVPEHIITPSLKLAKNPKQSTQKRAISTTEERICELNANCDADTNELFEAILAFKASCASEEEFSDGLAMYPRALRLWIHQQYESCHNLDGLCKILQRSGNPLNAGGFAAKVAFREASIDGRLKNLTLASSFASTQVPPTPSQTFYNQSLTDYKLLLTKQKTWEEELLHLSLDNKTELRDCCFLDRSVIDTIYNLIALAPFFKVNLVSEAIDLAQTFWVHPKQFWWTAVHSCIEMDQCQLLIWMMPHKKPIVELPSIVRACIEAEKLESAQLMANQANSDSEKSQLMEMIERAKIKSQTPNAKAIGSI